MCVPSPGKSQGNSWAGVVSMVACPLGDFGAAPKDNDCRIQPGPMVADGRHKGLEAANDFIGSSPRTFVSPATS
jgi:hypothetical protein